MHVRITLIFPNCGQYGWNVPIVINRSTQITPSKIIAGKSFASVAPRREWPRQRKRKSWKLGLIPKVDHNPREPLRPPGVPESSGIARDCNTREGDIMKNETVGIYTVNSDANILEGWTPETLADALREPLAEIGIAVECRPSESGLSLDTTPDDLRDYAQHIIERVIQATP